MGYKTNLFVNIKIKLDKTLKTLHLRLDSTSISLTKNSLSQLILKVLYSIDTSISIKELEQGLSDVLKTSIDDARINESIEKLVEQNVIKYDKKRYSLSRSYRKNLDKRYIESKERLERIVKTFFEPYHSKQEDVIEWFSDSTIEFFQSYSKEWVADICHTQSEKLKSKKEDIFKHIERRTENNKLLDKRDYNDLVKKYVDCLINKKDTDIDSHLWEYGTSAFAANLLQSSIGADPMSINAFTGAKCVLDTNVLMNIGLEASEYHNAIKKLDSIFKKLNVSTGYFHITEKEYINTVANLNKEILRNVSKFEYSVIKEIDDQFIQSAIKRQCHLYEDFETFCKQISTPPLNLESEQKIEIFNNDLELDRAIELAQNDPGKRLELNTIYKNITGRDKREAPLIHDVGLIAGIEFYRKKEKAIIISQEVSINRYSHTKPLADNLPLSIRLDTLISMLAIDNGGTDVDPTDFSNLFADMIRFNLQPEKATFQIADLSKLLDTELQIEQLPAEEVIQIANSVHSNIARGLSEDEIGLALNRQFQEIKLKFVDDLSKATEELTYQRGEKEKHKQQAERTNLALRNRIKKEELQKLDNTILKNKLIWYGAWPLAFLCFSCLGIYLYQHSEPLTNLQNYLIAIIGNVIIWVFTSLAITKPKLRKRTETLKFELEGKVEKRLVEETT